MGFGISEVAYFKRITGDGVIGDSGKPVDIVGYSILSGATAGTITFRNGSVVGAPIAWVDTAQAVSAERTIPLAYPIRLPLGCFADIDANVTAATIFYRQVLT